MLHYIFTLIIVLLTQPTTTEFTQPKIPKSKSSQNCSCLLDSTSNNKTPSKGKKYPINQEQPAINIFVPTKEFYKKNKKKLLALAKDKNYKISIPDNLEEDNNEEDEEEIDTKSENVDDKSISENHPLDNKPIIICADCGTTAIAATITATVASSSIAIPVAIAAITAYIGDTIYQNYFKKKPDITEEELITSPPPLIPPVIPPLTIETIPAIPVQGPTILVTVPHNPLSLIDKTPRILPEKEPFILVTLPTPQELFPQLIYSTSDNNNVNLSFRESNNDGTYILYNGNQQIGIATITDGETNENPSTKENLIAGATQGPTITMPDGTTTGVIIIGAGLGVSIGLGSGAGAAVVTVGGVAITGTVIPVIIGTAVVGYTVKLSVDAIHALIQHAKHKRAEKKAKKNLENNAGGSNNSGNSGNNNDKDPKDKKNQIPKNISNKNTKEHPEGIYKENPKHNQNSRTGVGKPPPNGQKAYEESIKVPGKPRQRVAVQDGKIIALKEHTPGEWHAYIEENFYNLDPEAQQALVDAGWVRSIKSGKIIKK